MGPRRGSRLAPVIVPALLILAGFALRAASMTAYRFHVDEALYATHARAVALEGDALLLAHAVDKPPLGVYVTAASFALLGVSEFAARLPNVLASALSLAALWALARRLDRAAFSGRAAAAGLALLLVALSPYDVLFAPTVFAEPQVTLWTVLACWAVAGDRWGWAGVAFGLALATKQSALFFLPLPLALGVIAHAGQGWRRLARFALPVLACAALLALWDAPRGPEQSFWALGYAHNAPDRWIRAGEVVPRLAAWAGWLRAFTGSDLLSLALAVAAVAGLARRALKWPRRRDTVIDLTLAGFALAYLGLLWLRAFNTYDRYVHALLPFLALLAARGAAEAIRPLAALAGNAWPKAGRNRAAPLWVIAAVLIVACAVGPLAAALRGDVAVGGDKGDHDGIEAAAAYLNTLAPGTRVCDHWLGWLLGFYLGGQTSVTLAWVPRPDALATHAPCYLPAPAGAPIARWLAVADQAGLSMERVFLARDRWGAPSFVVYRVA